MTTANLHIELWNEAAVSVPAHAEVKMLKSRYKVKRVSEIASFPVPVSDSESAGKPCDRLKVGDDLARLLGPSPHHTHIHSPCMPFRTVAVTPRILYHSHWPLISLSATLTTKGTTARPQEHKLRPSLSQACHLYIPSWFLNLP